MQTKANAKRPTPKTGVEITWKTNWNYFLKFMQIKEQMEKMQSNTAINPDRCLEQCIDKIYNQLISPIGLS